MSNVIRIANTGIFYANSFDEVTFNPNSGVQKNLFIWSQNFANTTVWANRNTIVSSNTLAPDGTYTATQFVYSLQFADINQTVNLVPGQPYTVSIYVKQIPNTTNGQYFAIVCNSGPVTNFDLLNVVVGNQNYGAYNAQITPAPNGYYRVSTSFIQTGTTNNISFWLGGYNGNINTGINMYLWGSQVEVGNTATIYEPTNTLGLPSSNSVQKIDSNGNVYITGALDEITFNPTSGVKKNLFAYSQQFNQSSQYSTTDTVTSNVILAPDGTMTGTLFQENTGVNTNHWISGGISDSKFTQYTISCYFKPYTGDRQFFFQAQDASEGGTGYASIASSNNGSTIVNSGVSGDFSNGSVNITPYNNGWFRASITFTTGSVTPIDFRIGLYNNGAQYYTGNGTSGIYIWGAQFEASNTATIYEATGANALPSQNSIVKVENTGNTYTIGSYDEWTGIVPTTNGLILNLDGAFPQSYSGTGLNINDLTGNPNNLFSGNAGSMPLYNPNYGSFYCDGINYKTITFYYTVPSIFYTNAFSLEVWIKPKILNTLASSGADSNIISIIENYGVNGFRFGLQTRNNLTTETTAAPIFFCNESGGTLIINALNSSLFPITIGKWSQIVVTYDGVNTGNMYVNGNFLLSSTGTYKPIASSSGAFFGGPAEGTNPMVGEFNSMKWYNRAITAQEVLANFNGLRNRYGI